MSKRRGAYKPLSQKAIKRILANNHAESNEQNEDKLTVNTLPEQTGIRLTRHMEYDSLHPEESIRNFLLFLSDVKSRYDEDMRIIEECQLQKQDLDHYAEMEENLDRTAGHAFYRKFREVWRKRRQCKNEAELLKPVIDFMETYKEAIDRLSHVQGRCAIAKETIDQREYVVRTRVLEGFYDV